MSVTPVYFQLQSAKTGNALIANQDPNLTLGWGPAITIEGQPFISWFTLLRYGPSNNYQVGTYFGHVLGAGGTFTVFVVQQLPPIPYAPPTNPLQGLGESSRSWHIMPNPVWIPGDIDQHFYQLINLTSQKALGVDPGSGQVAFVAPNTQEAAFYIRQANQSVVRPTVVAKDYFPAGNAAGVTLVGSNFGNYPGPFLACINNSVVQTNQTPTLSPAVNGPNPVLKPSWPLIAQNPLVVALTEDINKNVLFLNTIPA